MIETLTITSLLGTSFLFAFLFKNTEKGWSIWSYILTGLLFLSIPFVIAGIEDVTHKEGGNPLKFEVPLEAMLFVNTFVIVPVVLFLHHIFSKILRKGKKKDGSN